jgi:hypothetical protein
MGFGWPAQTSVIASAPSVTTSHFRFSAAGGELLNIARLDDIASSQGIDSVRALRFSVFFAE